jgi:hypothetical protein
MDFLDPKKQRRHALLLYAGYFLIGIAILISTIVLVYQANGFGVNGKGQVVQNGLVFFSSQPNPAKIYLNDELNQAQTNSRLSLPAGQYNARLTRDGYREWRHSINVQGGDVQNFDYPFLFPKTLTSKNLASYTAAPGLSTQSRDHRWLLVQPTKGSPSFDMYDLKNPADPATVLTIPATVLKSTAGVQNWELVQWADDNQHVLLKHTYGSASEYILVDRSEVAKTVNLNQTFGIDPATLSMIDNKYDQYYLLDAAGTLSSASLGTPALTSLVTKVISYKSYGSKTLLYATAEGAETGKVAIMVLVGDKSYTIRQMSPNTSYLLEMASYRNTPYVVLGAASENVTYIYKDPIGQLGDPKIKLPAAIRALKINGPNYVAFSPNAQYIVTESGSQFGVYDIFLHHAYVYTRPDLLEAPQLHATWMDGNRLTYVAGGKVVVFDFDRRNPQTLMNARAEDGVYFSADYKYAYTLTVTGAATALTQTPLVITADL